MRPSRTSARWTRCGRRSETPSAPRRGAPWYVARALTAERHRTRRRRACTHAPPPRRYTDRQPAACAPASRGRRRQRRAQRVRRRGAHPRHALDRRREGHKRHALRHVAPRARRAPVAQQRIEHAALVLPLGERHDPREVHVHGRRRSTIRRRRRIRVQARLEVQPQRRRRCRIVCAVQQQWRVCPERLPLAPPFPHVAHERILHPRGTRRIRAKESRPDRVADRLPRRRIRMAHLTAVVRNAPERLERRGAARESRGRRFHLHIHRALDGRIPRIRRRTDAAQRQGKRHGRAQARDICYACGGAKPQRVIRDRRGHHTRVLLPACLLQRRQDRRLHRRGTYPTSRRKMRAPLVRHDAQTPRLDDTGFFVRNGRESFTQQRLVVEVDGADDAREHILSRKHIRSVQSTAHADLDHQHLGSRLGRQQRKRKQRLHGEQLERRRVDRRVRAGCATRDIRRARLLLGQRPRLCINRHPAVHARTVARQHEVRTVEARRPQPNAMRQQAIKVRGRASFSVGAGDMDHREARMRRADAAQQRLHAAQTQIHPPLVAPHARRTSWPVARDAAGDPSRATMSGWTTIWVLIVAVIIGAVTWTSTPKGPNQV